MDPIIFENVKHKHDTAEAFISLFFAAVDAFIFILLLILFGWETNQNCFSNLTQRQKLSLLIISDAIIRIINLYISSFIYSLVTEIIQTSFATFQFYLVISLLNHIFISKYGGYANETPEINYIYCSCIFFFVISIALNTSKMISLVQYICAIAAIIYYKHYIERKVDLFLSEIAKQSSKFKKSNIIQNFPLFIALYYLIYNILKIIRLYVENLLYQSYMEMFLDIFKEVGKYLSFMMVISLYYIFDKYIQKYDYDFSNDSKQDSVNISSISSSKNKK